MYNECYENLANAIILRAIDDYKEAKKIPRNTQANIIKKEKIINDVTSFLKSQYFQSLTNISGDAILKELEKQ